MKLGDLRTGPWAICTYMLWTDMHVNLYCPIYIRQHVTGQYHYKYEIKFKEKWNYVQSKYNRNLKENVNLRINYLFYLLRRFCPDLGNFFFFFHNVSANYERQSLLGIRLRVSAFLSEDVVNHLKKARGEIWRKRSERRRKKTTKMRTKSPQ